MLNEPPYIITDVFTDLVAKLAIKLARPVYSYYGYVTELNESLQQLSESPSLFDKKFPLVWLAEPFTIVSDLPQNYGKIKELRMFIMTGSEKNYKSYERKEKTFKPILYPIQWELFNQMDLRKEFSAYRAKQNFELTDRYYWGENQKSVLNDVVDTIEVRFLNIKVQNNLNC